MKKWLYPAAVLAAIALLSRLPHPSRDISRLEPVQAVYLYMEAGELHIETDTGDHGSGHDLTEATDDMKESSDGEIFLETAEFLILDPQVPITPDFYELLRPDCRVFFTTEKPDLPAAAKYLSIHTPKTTLAHLRAQTS
ncbi:MAG: hypothetical protein IJE58_00735 [Oscillospiraceae bacterium]|nr:hypothetical protein [Oscillospiraceae bacterium]